MTTDNDWTRLARYFAGECGPDEVDEVRRWLDADPERQRVADELRAAWDIAAVPATTWDTPASWQRLAARVRARERRAAVALVRPAAALPWRRRSRWWPAAAAAAIVAAAGGLLWRTMPVHSTARRAVAAMSREVRTAPTQRTTFRLADGSSVILAPASVLRYDPSRFGHPTRELYLEGRAYFDVTHDARRPFVVHTARATTEDLGTKFVVADYPADATVEVAVAAGSVAVRSAAGDRGRPATVLARNGLAQLDGAGRVMVRRGVDVSPQVAWTEGRLAFVDAPVTDVVHELGRWYGLDIRLDDTSLVRQRFTASYTTQSDSVVLREFATAIGARVERRGAIVMLFR